MKEVISGLPGNQNLGKKVKSVTFCADNPIYNEIITDEQWESLCEHQRMMDELASVLFLALQRWQKEKKMPKKRKKPKIPGGYRG